MILTPPSDHFLVEHQSVGLYNGHGFCYLWGRNWIFIQNSDEHQPAAHGAGSGSRPGQSTLRFEVDKVALRHNFLCVGQFQSSLPSGIRDLKPRATVAHDNRKWHNVPKLLLWKFGWPLRRSRSSTVSPQKVCSLISSCCHSLSLQLS